MSTSSITNTSTNKAADNSARKLGVSRETPKIFKANSVAATKKITPYRSTVVMPNQMIAAIKQRLDAINISQKKRSAWLEQVFLDLLNAPNMHAMVVEEFITHQDNSTIGFSISPETKAKMDTFIRKHPECDMSQLIRSAVARELLYKRRASL